MPQQVLCPLCSENLVDDVEFSEPVNTCLTCIEFYDNRIALAEAEKHKTKGEILKDGLFGSDDLARPSRGKGISTRGKAAPMLAIDNRKGSSKRIDGNPRTATFRKGRR